ncbi:MAG: L-threonylcarbamoyladenylate synthase [bacterium]
MPITLRVRPGRPNDSAVLEAAAIIRAGGIVVFPTETVYGIGIGLDHAGSGETGVARVSALKGRPAGMPVLLHCASVQDIPGLARSMPRSALDLVQAFLPGPLALVLPASDRVPAALQGPGGTVGIRVVALPVTQALIRRVGTPLAGSSANPHGTPATAGFSELDAAILAGADVILDSGRCGTGLASTVVDLATGPPRLLREGAIPRAAVESVLDVRLAESG